MVRETTENEIHDLFQEVISYNGSDDVWKSVWCSDLMEPVYSESISYAVRFNHSNCWIVSIAFYFDKIYKRFTVNSTHRPLLPRRRRRRPGSPVVFGTPPTPTRHS